MWCIVAAVHIYAYISYFKHFSWFVACYVSLFLSSKIDEKDENKIETYFIKIFLYFNLELYFEN